MLINPLTVFKFSKKLHKLNEKLVPLMVSVQFFMRHSVSSMFVKPQLVSLDVEQQRLY